jgi:hypothetical protein
VRDKSIFIIKIYLSRKKECLTGIPLCPKTMGRKEETPYGYTIMPKNHGQERGKEILHE